MTVTVSIETFSDADFSRAFRLRLDDVPTYYDFTDHTLLLMVRKTAADEEVFVSLSSPDDGIDIYPFEAEEELTVFAVNISRLKLSKMAPGEYVHSLIAVRPDGLRDDIWRGTLTHAIGPTR